MKRPTICRADCIRFAVWLALFFAVMALSYVAGQRTRGLAEAHFTDGCNLQAIFTCGISAAKRDKELQELQKLSTFAFRV